MPLRKSNTKVNTQKEREKVKCVKRSALTYYDFGLDLPQKHVHSLKEPFIASYGLPRVFFVNDLISNLCSVDTTQTRTQNMEIHKVFFHRFFVGNIFNIRISKSAWCSSLPTWKILKATCTKKVKHKIAHIVGGYPANHMREKISLAWYEKQVAKTPPLHGTKCVCLCASLNPKPSYGAAQSEGWLHSNTVI